MPVTIVIHFLNKKSAMDEEFFKEGTKEIHYVNLKPPVFQITNDDIKAGKFV